MIICDWCKEEVSYDPSTKFYAGLFYAGKDTHLGPPKVSIRLDMHQTCGNEMGDELKLEIQSIILRKEKQNARS